MTALQTWQAQARAEAFYFHDFVVDILFPADTESADFRLYTRKDITRFVVDWMGSRGNVSRELAAERLNLYVFRTGAALLVVELRLCDPTAWSLADLQDFHERFRRGYSPYAHDDLSPGGIVRQVELHRTGGAPTQIFTYGVSDHCAAAAAYVPLDAGQAPRRHAQPLDHWVALLDGALPLANDDPKAPVWRQTSDDRIPALLSVSVTDDVLADPLAQYRSIRRGDAIRLCFGDGAGTAPFPYDEAALEDFERRHAYDWFRARGARFLVSEQTFVALGAGRFFDTHIHPTHMRRHYFQMALLVHVEAASLLAFSRTISRFAQAFQGSITAGAGLEARESFAAHMRNLHEDYLQFVHRFHFTGVSHQMQGRALFALWRERAGLPDLFRDLQAEITASNTFLQAEWERDRTGAADRQANAAHRLTAVATLGVAFGLPMAFLGMNTLDDRTVEWIGGMLGIHAKASQIVVTLSVIGLFALLSLWPLRLALAGSSRDADDPMNAVRRWLGRVGWGALLLATAVAGASHWIKWMAALPP